MDEDIIYFDKSHAMLKVIKNYIISQCSSVCREKIHNETIDQAFSEFDFGFVRKTVRAITGIRNFRKNQKEIVHSFVLCKYISYDNTKINSIDIQLLCNSKNNSQYNKDGVNLLRLVETKARSEGIDVLTLFSLGHAALKHWYIKQDFKVIKEITLPNTKKVKVYAMSKKI